MQCEYYDISGNDSDNGDYSDLAAEYCEEPVGGIATHGLVNTGMNCLSETHEPESGMPTTVISPNVQNTRRTYRDAQNINKNSGIKVNRLAQANGSDNYWIEMAMRVSENWSDELGLGRGLGCAREAIPDDKSRLGADWVPPDESCRSKGNDHDQARKMLVKPKPVDKTRTTMTLLVAISSQVV